MITIYRKQLIYVAIIALQILFIVYWADCKVNFHVDELYSMGYASNYTGYGDKGQYITTNSSDFRFNEWISISGLKKHLVVSGEESVFNIPIFVLIKKIFTERNYVILLNIVESIAGFGSVSLIPSLVLNVILYIISAYYYVKLMKKLKMDERIRFLALAMFGFSVYMISTVLYVRFYMLVVLLMILMLNCFYEAWDSDSWCRIIAMISISFILCDLSLRNSEITIPFFGVFMLCFIIGCIIRVKKKQLIVSAGLCVVGLVFIASMTDYIGILLNPNLHQKSSTVYTSASLAIRNASFGTIKLYLGWLFGLFKTHLFSSPRMLYLLVAIVATALIISFKGGVRIKKIKFSTESDFMMILLSETIILVAFEVLCEFGIWRYYCFAFVSIATLLWYVLDRIYKKIYLSKSQAFMFYALIVFVIINALVPFHSRKIENIYEEERDFVDSVQSTAIPNVVLVTSEDAGTVSRHEIYDCVNLIPQDASLFITDIKEYDLAQIGKPKEMILWTHLDKNIDAILEDLSANGYIIQELGSDHCSKSYICRL